MWIWRGLVTAVLLGLWLVADLGESLRLLLGIVLATGVFISAYDLMRVVRRGKAR